MLGKYSIGQEQKPARGSAVRGHPSVFTQMLLQRAALSTGSDQKDSVFCTFRKGKTLNGMYSPLPTIP